MCLFREVGFRESVGRRARASSWACVWLSGSSVQKGGRALARSRLSWGSSCEMSGVNTRTTKRDSDRDARESQHSSTPHPTSTDSAQLLLGATGSSSSTHNVSQGAPQMQPPTSSSSQCIRCSLSCHANRMIKTKTNGNANARGRAHVVVTRSLALSPGE